LYQQMLEEAVLSLKTGIAAPTAERWSPQITIGTPVLIPEDYVADLSVRLPLFRRLAGKEEARRVGPLRPGFGSPVCPPLPPTPPGSDYLLKICPIKGLCRRPNVKRIGAGPKGAVIPLRDNPFAHREALVAFTRDQGPSARVRPDMKVVFFADWESSDDRL